MAEDSSELAKNERRSSRRKHSDHSPGIVYQSHGLMHVLHDRSTGLAQRSVTGADCQDDGMHQVSRSELRLNVESIVRRREVDRYMHQKESLRTAIRSDNVSRTIAATARVAISERALSGRWD